MESVGSNIVAQSVINEIVKEVEMTNEERCGFLLGNEQLTQWEILTIRTATNSTQRDRLKNYEIASVDYQNAEKFADEHEMTLLGVYHSHINCPATPSEYDRRAAQPHFLYMIISVINRKAEDIRCWKLNSDREFKEENITIV